MSKAEKIINYLVFWAAVASFAVVSVILVNTFSVLVLPRANLGYPTIPLFKICVHVLIVVKIGMMYAHFERAIQTEEDYYEDDIYD
jgi:hypothetical protein